MMERRRTLDKLHRLGFGKRSASTEVKPSSKAEKLRELTELLKGSRGSSSSSSTPVPTNSAIPAPPPLPPPLPPPVPLRNKRKSKTFLLRSQQSTDSEHSESISSLPPIDSEPLISVSSPALEMHSSGTISPNSIPSPIVGSPPDTKQQTLRPNSSTSNLEAARSKNELYDPNASKSTNYLDDEDFLTKLTRPEARQIIGSYTQSTIPFRSASFSQADYQAYKYRKDAKSSLDLENAKKSIDKSTDTNRYPEKSELNLSLGENGRLTENVPHLEVEVATDALEAGSKRNSDIETIVEDHEETQVESKPKDLKIVQASEVELEPLMEEEAPLTPTMKSEEQKANTCVIPIPVYDTVVKEWSTTSPSEQWIGEQELQKIEHPELTKGMSIESKCCEIESDNILDVCQNPEGKIEDHIESFDTKESVKDPLEISESSKPEVVKEDELVELRNSIPDLGQVEVRKRHSNNDGNYQVSDSGPNSPLLSPTEEKRRIDKSKRRKGIYIQWPAIENAQEASFDSSTSNAGDATPPWQCSITPEVFETGELESDLNKIKIINELEKDSSSAKETLQVPEGQESQPKNEASDSNPSGNVQRGSLTYQSSDERDDSLLSTHPLRQFKNLFIRGDSVSDNECDRSHERTSASPAPHSGDADLKRYSKRPLRGPYGQMLEAEMKKPSPKVHYEELLEELNRKVESLTPMRSRGVSSLSFDESIPQGQSKMKNRKSNTLLPVPSHTRTASSPSQLLEITQRSPSPIPHTRTDSTAEKPSTKKLSLDCHHANLETGNKPKRASSDTTDKHSKRSSSSASDKSDKHGRYSSRTPSERSFILHTPETPKGPVPSPELLAELLKGSSEKLTTEQHQRSSRGANAQNNQPPASGDYGCDLPPAIVKCLNVSDADQRIHVVIELYHTEQNYVESLQTIVMKYMNPLKSPENSGIIDANLVDEIFFMIPSILKIHERFLDELKCRFETWDPMQKVGDAFIEVFSDPSILETYTSFINNSPKAKNAIRTACSQRPQFARFLAANAREHKRKLTLDHLLITPVQKFPWYELIFARLIKHTDLEHPDQKSLQEASKLVHNILLHINCMEKEALENGHREATLKDLESVIEGINDLVTPDRAFLLFDLVTMPFGQATRKERGFFLFSDLLVITSIKRRSGTIRKPVSCPVSVAITLDTHKYKLLTKIALDDLEIVKSKDENVRRIMKEIEQLTEDCNKLQQISELTVSLRCPHQVLEDTIRDLQREIQRQLNDRQSNDSQLSQLELTLNSPTGAQTMTVVFSKPEKRTQWEESFTEAKQKLATSVEKHPTPEFISSVPIRKTRAGLQFTCASPTLGGQKDVWVCNSDGYVGQVCVLSLLPEPTVTSCNGVCNSRILCVASVPASIENQRNSHHSTSSPAVSISLDDSTPQTQQNTKNPQNKVDEDDDSSNVRLESSSSSDDSEGETPSCDKSVAATPPSAPSVVETPILVPQHQQQDSLGSNTGDDTENNHNQSTMWLGTEDGCIHVYNCTDNIRIKKNKIKIQHVSAVYSILYLDNRVFVSLANGDILVYTRDMNGWNTQSPLHISVGTVTEPVTKLLNVLGKLWCSIQGIIKILNTSSLQVENQIQISNESKPITNMAALSNCVWVSIQNSAHIKCFHSTSYELLFEVNLAPSVNKMLSNCDDIIRQHKAACLRVTSLLACKDLIWVGTSAGVLLTIPAQGLTQGSAIPPVTGIPHGHTGHVRFLTTVETSTQSDEKPNRLSIHGKNKPEMYGKTLVISGGDGYEDFRSSGNNTMSEIAGREDSTNHLLLWEV
ncbi:rho guanine nucleotide exchange factor 17 [Culicoides brevitarsis]|uniref:rho guanine nucleotide exchange factor 17 n=1 Tax=Culicoides brevitarsis TaxID=469753 RepID=UPI00307BD340